MFPLTFPRRLSRGWFVLLCLVAAGCSGNPEASRESATVTGKVLLYGKPPTNGKITFDARNPDRIDVQPATAQINADGTYSVEAVVGRNSVFLDSKEIQTDPRYDQYRGGGDMRFTVVKGADNKHDVVIGPAP